jgi:hypothetical protein
MKRSDINKRIEELIELLSYPYYFFTPPPSSTSWVQREGGGR